MEIKDIKIEELKAAEYNPRRLTEGQEDNLTKSIKRFGLVDPIIVNKAENRKNIVIGGHQRLKIIKKLEWKEAPVVYVDIPDIEKEKELNIRLNKNLGEWDYKLLADFDEEILLESGFEEDELMVNIGLSNVDEVLLDEDRMEVISVDAPESPRLKIRESFYCKDIRDFNLIKKFFNSRNGKLDIKRLLDLIK